MDICCNCALPRFSDSFFSNTSLIHPHPGPTTPTNVKFQQRGSNSSKPRSVVTIAHLNVRSLSCHEKFFLVCQTVVDHDYDIFTVSETWLNPSTSDAHNHIPGYVLFRQDRV